MNGEFKITVPEQPEIILQFSFIGMKNKDVEYKGEPALKIVLEEDVAEMEEVIVTGIFTRKAESYTGAAVTVTQDQLKRVGNQNIFQSLRNIDPSLAISDNLDFGSDPNKLPDMKLRGTSSFPGADDGLDLKGNYMNKPNQPLFILDGFRGERRENFRYGYEPGGECDYPERCFCQGLVWFQSSQWGGGYRDQTFVIRTAEGDL